MNNEQTPGVDMINNDDFIDLDDELVDADDYGDYGEEDESVATAASPNSKKTKVSSQSNKQKGGELQRQRSASSDNNTSRYDPQIVAN